MVKATTENTETTERESSNYMQAGLVGRAGRELGPGFGGACWSLAGCGGIAKGE
jgi:hypothetical protein